jgi:hypothetical protein
MNIRNACEWLIIVSVVAGNVASAQGWPSAAAPQAASAAVPFVPPGVDDPVYAYECPPPPSNMESIYAQLLPSDRGWCYDYDSRLDLTLRQMLAGAWFRLEYLQGSVYRDDGNLLGAPTAITTGASGPSLTTFDYFQRFAITRLEFDPAVPGVATVADPTQQFAVIYSDGLTTSLAQVPTTRSVRWNNAQGIRGSFGFPVTDRIGIESRWWNLGNASDTISTGPFPADGTVTNSVRVARPGTTGSGTQNYWQNPALLGPNGSLRTSFLATTLTTNGAPGSGLIIYDSAFHSFYSSSLWTGDADIVYNLKIPEQGWRVQTILGYRHEQFDEHLNFGGTFSNNPLGRQPTTTGTGLPSLTGSAVPPAVGYVTALGTLTDPVSNSFDSSVDNSRNQAQFGLRLEWAHKGITLGAQEKIALGVNSVDSVLAVQNVRDPGNSSLGTVDDPALTVTSANSSVFAPTSDLELYLKLRMADWCNFRIGWQLVWMGKVGVADQGIRYNQTVAGGVSTADVAAQIGYKDRVFSLLTLGGEILLP